MTLREARNSLTVPGSQTKQFSIPWDFIFPLGARGVLRPPGRGFLP